MSLEDAQHLGGDDLECYCLTQGYEKIFESTELQEACWDWILKVGEGLTIKAIASMVIVSINVGVELLLRGLAKFGRPLSLTERDSSIMGMLATAQTLNTGFVALLVNWHFPEWAQDLVQVTGIGGFVGRGDYDDFVRGWYGVVGAMLVLNMAVSTFLPSFKNVMTQCKVRLVRCCYTSDSCCCKRRVKHQAKLLKIYTNPRFDIAQRFAQLQVIVFVTMTYSSGLPALSFLAAIYMFCMYWVDSWVLLRGSQRPPYFDSRMPAKAVHCLLYAVPLHLVFAIFMLGQSCSFPSSPLGEQLSSVDSHAQISLLDGVRKRIWLNSTWMQFFFLVLVVALWVLWTILWTVGSTFGQVWKCLAATCCARQGKVAGFSEEQWTMYTWQEAKPFIAARYPPASYRHDVHPAFKKGAAQADNMAKLQGVLPSHSPVAASSSASPAPEAAQHLQEVVNRSTEQDLTLEDAVVD
jgi:hypothetical protein